MNTKGPNHQWIKYGLTRRISASENFPRHYQEYLALGNEICKDISFKDYFYCIFAFWLKRANEDMLKKNRPLERETGCSTTQNRKEEGKGTKGQGLPKPSIYWSFMRSFGFYWSGAKAGEDPICTIKWKEENDSHSHPSTIIERNHETPISLGGEAEKQVDIEEC